ncbi:hypothetical protein G5B37_05440 [Rasiella rasia]|uniref:Uncharacterized protein n=1 Tax=Rasiella rasia TaxID=2744027 RepID=A0A6G6GKC1_9FLAO|nr:hypothetical protein [Rasiella rasia]QIE59025.1 hypothetical protein G5B37_05440 [Rasiella rasia]
MRLFHESQKFNQVWLVILMMSTVAITIGALAMSYPKVAPSEMTDFLAVSIPTVVLVLTITVLIFTTRLETKIDSVGVHYGFWPFQRKLRTASWHEIQSCRVRKYSPLREFGGWGYKFSLSGHGKVYNTKGNMGIQIVFNSGKKTLVGTQKPEEARQILERFTKNKNV